MSVKYKNIVLFSLYSVGHNVAFMRLFSKSLLELGCNVMIIMPEEHKVSGWVKALSPEYAARLTSFELTPVTKPSYKGKFGEARNVFSVWKQVATQIKKAEKTIDFKIDLVFLAWADSFMANYLPYQLIDFIFPYKWSGLYFHPRFMRFNPDADHSRVSVSSVDYVFLAKNCINIAIHDGLLVDKLQKRLHKPVIFFPEIADSTAPNNELPVLKEIKQRAANRLIVGMIGLDERKGLLTLVRLAKEAPSAEFFFLFAGVLNLNDFSEEEVKEIKDFFDKLPENCYAYLNYLQEGEAVNSFINLLDIIYIVYNNFPSTSNFNTKGAIFKKLVLATERFIIGEETKEYNLGVTVEEKNVSQCINGLQLLKQKIHKGDYSDVDFDGYMKKHGLPALNEAFLKIIGN